jgi:hypothetical protein
LSAVSLYAALARLREQALGVTSGTSGHPAGGPSPAGGETQQPQGIAETGTSGTSETSEKEEHGLNHPCGPTAARNPGAPSKTVVPVVPVVPSQQLRGFEVGPPPEAPVVPVVPPWADFDAWRSRFRPLTNAEDRRDVVRAWADAAGGWADAAAIHLPVSLPGGLTPAERKACALALAEMKTHAHALRLDVREDPDDPEHMSWLREAAPVTIGPACEHCRHFRRDDGRQRAHLCRQGGYCLSQRQGGACGPSARLWSAAP